MTDLSLSPPAPVYLVHGEEAMLRAEAVAAIRQAVLDEGMADFNLERFDGGQCGGADVVAAAQMLPVMAERRLVVVRFVERMKAEDLAPLAAQVRELLEARAALAQWVRGGSLRYREDILEGIDQAPGAIAGLYRGENLGKRLIRLAQDQ